MAAADAPAAFVDCSVTCLSSSDSFERQKARPANTPTAIAIKVETCGGPNKVTPVARMAKAIRRRSGASDCCMVSTACATTATATSCRP
jgi:hypothetical protein